METAAGSLTLAHPVQDAENDRQLIREGRFQRSLALLTAGTSIISGLEVAYEHYRGSYSRRVMYTPVILSAVLWRCRDRGFLQPPRGARACCGWLLSITLVDAAVGFYFHVRGIHRKPGGWRLPMTNMIMGPPIFAPLLFGTSAYLGLIASYLQREDANQLIAGDAIGDQNQTTGGWLARLLPAARRPRSHLRRAGHSRRKISAPGCDRRRHQCAAQRI